MSKKIVVLGSSFGGFRSALELRKHFAGSHQIQVVSSENILTFLPSLPWVVIGWREPESIQFNIADHFKKLGIGFVQDTIIRAEPDKNCVIGKNGEYNYDYLIAATGSELDFDAISGINPNDGHTHSIFTSEQAMQSHRDLMNLFKSGSGSIVLGNAQGASCLGPAYEMAMIIDSYLCKKSVRNRFNISLFTNEPHLGHFGVCGFGKMTRMLEDEFADRNIEWKVNAKILNITPDNVELEDGTKYKNDFSLIVPAFYGSHAYMDVDGLANPRGFLLADDYLANPKYQNIYAVGVSLAIPSPFQTPVPLGVPKTGQMTEAMAKVAAWNIKADIRGEKKQRGKDFSVTCIADAGSTGFYLSASPMMPPRNKLVHKKGVAARWLKIAFEKYYMASLRYNLPPLDFGW